MTDGCITEPSGTNTKNEIKEYKIREDDGFNLYKINYFTGVIRPAIMGKTKFTRC